VRELWKLLDIVQVTLAVMTTTISRFVTGSLLVFFTLIILPALDGIVRGKT